MDHAGNVGVGPNPSNTGVSAIRCHQCGVIPKTLKRRRTPDCGPVQLTLSRGAADRKHLRTLIYASQLPQGEFAQYVLGVDQATLWRYLQGSVIPVSKVSQVRSIRHIERQGNDLHIVLRTCAEKPRWNYMKRRRDREWTA